MSAVDEALPSESMLSAGPLPFSSASKSEKRQQTPCGYPSCAGLGPALRHGMGACLDWPSLLLPSVAWVLPCSSQTHSRRPNPSRRRGRPLRTTQGGCQEASLSGF